MNRSLPTVPPSVRNTTLQGGVVSAETRPGYPCMYHYQTGKSAVWWRYSSHRFLELSQPVEVQFESLTSMTPHCPQPYLQNQLRSNPFYSSLPYSSKIVPDVIFWSLANLTPDNSSCNLHLVRSTHLSFSHTTLVPHSSIPRMATLKTLYGSDSVSRPELNENFGYAC